MNVEQVEAALTFLAEKGWYLWRVDETRIVTPATIGADEKLQSQHDSGWGFARSGSRANQHWPTLEEAITEFLAIKLDEASGRLSESEEVARKDRAEHDKIMRLFGVIRK